MAPGAFARSSALLGLLWALATSPVARAQEPMALEVVFEEIAWMGSTGSSNDEWIELFNNTGADIDVTGWSLQATDLTPDVVLVGIIPAGGSFLLERTDDTSVPTVPADQIYTGALENGGEMLELRDGFGILQDRVDDWFAGDSGARETMQRLDPLVAGIFSDNWIDGPVDGDPANGGIEPPSEDPCEAIRRARSPIRGPLAMGGRPPVPGEVLINEVMARPGCEPEACYCDEWVELHNTTAEALDLGGMSIDDGSGGGSPQAIPPGTVVAPGGLLLFELPSDILNNTGGDTVELLDADGATLHDEFAFLEADEDKTWCRKPEQGAFPPFQCTPTPVDPNRSAEPWQPGTLEVRIFKAGHGENQLIIGPTGRTLLTGIKEPSFNSDKGSQLMAEKIFDITGGFHVDYLAPSHWHLDHMGYASIGGYWALLEKFGFTAGKLLDRDGGRWADDGDGVCEADEPLDFDWQYAGTFSGTAFNWMCWATDPSSLGGAILEIAQLGSTSQIDLGSELGVVVQVAQVDGLGVTMADGVTPITGDFTDDVCPPVGSRCPPSENDYSMTLWVRWNDFDYVTGGDTDGEYSVSGFGYSYNDVESVVAQRIRQQVEAIWVNHHGSKHSTHASYVGILEPRVALFGVGRNSFGHPDQRVLDILADHGTDMYFPELGEPDRDYRGAFVLDEDVVLRTDGFTFDVGDMTYLAAPPSPRLALTQSRVVRGRPATFTIGGAQPGETVYLLRSFAGQGAGPCLPQIGGQCLDILGPLALLGTALTDATGTATFSVSVPLGVPPVELTTQAGVVRGPGGVDSLLSNVLTVPVESD